MQDTEFVKRTLEFSCLTLDLPCMIQMMVMGRPEEILCPHTAAEMAGPHWCPHSRRLSLDTEEEVDIYNIYNIYNICT